MGFELIFLPILFIPIVFGRILHIIPADTLEMVDIICGVAYMALVIISVVYMLIKSHTFDKENGNQSFHVTVEDGDNKKNH